MNVDAVIFDMDGTLVDTNAIHVESWRRAFHRLGLEIDEDRIMAEIGKGGDMLVPSILDEEAEAAHGEELRDYCCQEFLSMAGSQSIQAFPSATELLQSLREHGIKTAIATSATQEHLDAIQRSAGYDFQGAVDAVVTATDAEKSKPEPDIVLAAVEKLGVAKERCIMIGDTPHDAEACRRAGVSFVGLTGGGHSRETLEEAGAVSVWQDTADLIRHLDEVVELEPQPSS
jgi:HAD superfamily hydrolase (TIGR01549 family)